MKFQLCFVTILTLLCVAGTMTSESARAEEIDFGKIDKFESLGTGTLHVGSPPKTIVDDGERHTVILTIWESNAETKAYWKTMDGSPRTTVIPGRGVQSFQTAGEFRLEAIGDAHHSVEYGYLLLRLKTQ